MYNFNFKISDTKSISHGIAIHEALDKIHKTCINIDTNTDNTNDDNTNTNSNTSSNINSNSKVFLTDDEVK